MKKAERQAYLVLTNVELPGLALGYQSYTCLCSWCRYAQSGGDCYVPYFECNHPLYAIEDVAERVFEGCTGEGLGADCWGFRPQKGITPEDAADMVGIWLTGKAVVWPEGVKE